MYYSKQKVLDKLNITEDELMMWTTIGHINYSQRTDKWDIDSVLSCRTMTIGLDKIIDLECKEMLLSIMEKQSSLKRRIFSDIQQGRDKTAAEYDKIGQTEFGMLSYLGMQAHGAAKGIAESGETWYLKTIKNLENKIGAVKETIEDARTRPNDFDPRFIKGKKKHLRTLMDRLAKIQSKGYLPTWFGRAKKDDPIKYREARMQLYVGGEVNHKGNRFIRIQRNKTGEYELKIFNRTFPIAIPTAHKETFTLDEFNRQTARISFNDKGNLVLNITYYFIKQIEKTITTKQRGVVGIDIGPKEIAVAFVKNDGNAVHYEHFPTGNLLDKRAEDTKREISLILDKILRMAEHFGMHQITIENLKFKPDHSYRSKNLNRMLSKFPRQIFKSLLESKCTRRGFKLKLINPAYTSYIGLMKYSNRDNLCTSHNAKSKDLSAALVIGRRGLKLKEKAVVSVRLFGKMVTVPVKSILTSLEDDVRKLDGKSPTNSNWSLWSRLKKLFKTSDELTAHLLATPGTLQQLADSQEMRGSRRESLNLALMKIGVLNY